MKRWIKKSSMQSQPPGLVLFRKQVPRVRGFESSIPRNIKGMHWSDLVSNEELPGGQVSRTSPNPSISTMFAVSDIFFNDLMATQPESSTSSTCHLQIGGWKNVVRQNL